MNGVAFAGNLIVDHIKTIERLPGRSELAKILSQLDSTGGCVCNTGIDLATLAPELPVSAHGVAGNDADGDRVLRALLDHGIDTRGVLRRGITSYTDVYAEQSTACRTFFQYGGANDSFDVDDVDVAALDAKIFHIGYLLLLGRLDSPDPEYGTRMARLLKRVRARGCLTSIDMVSEQNGAYERVVLPALPYVDYLIINEIEAGHVAGVPLTDDSGALLTQNMPLALRRLLDAGVSRWAIIHTASGAYGLEPGGKPIFEPSKRLPNGYIAGTVGAGDAFCAGALLAAHRELSLADALRYGNASAMVSLRSDTATGGMCSMSEALARYDQMA